MTTMQMFGLSIMVMIPLVSIVYILHITCDKLRDVLEGVVLLMKYVLDKEHYDDGNNIFRNKDN